MDTAEFRVERDAWPDDVLPREPTFPLEGAPVHEHLREQGRDQGTEPALTFYGHTLSWSELDDHVDRFATVLYERGHRPGDICALYLQNCPQFWIAYHGAQRAGLTVAPLNPQLRDVVLEYLLEDNEASAIVAHTNLLENVESVAAETALEDGFAVQYRTYADVANARLPVHEVVAGEKPIPDWEGSNPGNLTLRPFADAVTAVDPRRDLPEPSPEDRALLQYTGGTSGMPKACVHSHWNVTYKAVIRNQGPDRDEVQLAVMPVFHVAGKLGTVDGQAVSGNHVVILPRYTPEAMLAAIDAYDVTSTWIAVPMIEEILESDRLEEYDLTSLSATSDAMTCTSFGTNITAALSDRWEVITGARLKEGGYGLSETHTGDVNTAGIERVEPGFVGQPTYGVEVEIRDFETNEVLPVGEEGEIVLYTPSMMAGYHDRPAATNEVLEADGALHTGDVGRLTEEGFLYFLGRRKDTLKVSGHTLSPREVEYAIEESGLVQDALVVGRPHESRGHVPEAHVIPADGVTEDAVLSWADEHLAEFKRPRSVVLVDELPRTSVGKVDRKTYRERLPNDYA
ncbi:hypothetical protein D8Y22_18080 [Salinadaptatus halalkaliphilus]|uniref:AMP-dependent synthetase n=1 Tax=Salinadaptatus halalkaliphilus TaxID=2419781 RepID=A0A4S3TL76_9EURY|nr:AMP-binding protein [Salinadaptatus halalkaliphilus]THE63715.1 hypothetical protein D8Y22_18080 [Salinadaptatus halalkaliphilus]